MSYIGTEPKDIRSFGRTKFDYTATQGQTAFTGADDDGKVLAFTEGQIEVYVNGILMDDSDFTTTGTGTVTLVSAANLNDVINIVSFESNIPDNDYVPASGGTFSGTVAHTGDVTITGNANDANGNLKVTTNTPANNPAMVIETSTGGNSTEVHGLHIKNTAAGHGLRIDDEASDTTPFVVASDGKVGIGTTTPTSALSIEGSGFTDSTIRLKRTAAGTNNDAGLQFTSAAGANSGYGMGGIWFKNSLDDNAYALIRARTDDSTGTSGRLDFITSDAAVGNATASRLTIDSLGRVTMPNQPAFHAFPSSSSTNNWTGSNGDIVPFDATTLNVGSHYNTTNYRFVVPISGVYFFYYRNTSSTWYGDIGLYKNASQWIEMEQRETHTTWRHHFDGALVQCSTNDYIDIRVETTVGGSATLDGAARYWDGFGGYLVS